MSKRGDCCGECRLTDMLPMYVVSCPVEGCGWVSGFMVQPPIPDRFVALGEESIAEHAALEHGAPVAP